MIRLSFVREAAFSSDVIAWFSHGHFSHVDAMRANGQLLGARSDKVGGAKPGVHYRAPDYAYFARRLIMDVPATPKQHDLFWEFLEGQIGKPYDWEALWAFAGNRDWRAPDSWICSEIVTAAGEYAGVVHRLVDGPNKITPVTCSQIFSAVGGYPVNQISEDPLPVQQKHAA